MDLGSRKGREVLLQGRSVVPRRYVGDPGRATPDGYGTVPTSDLLPDLLNPLTPPRIRETGETVDEGSLQRGGVPPPIPEAGRMSVGHPMKKLNEGK